MTTATDKQVAGQIKGLALSFVVLLLVWLGVFTPTAGATYRHLSRETTFGPDGTAITETNSFGFLTSQEIFFDNASRRLFVLRPTLYQLGDGKSPIQPPRGIFAYDMSNPDSPEPLGDNFPLPLSAPLNANMSHMAIDESEGDIYYLEGTQSSSVNRLYSWDEDGNPREGFPVEIPYDGPMAVDPLGYLWVLSRSEETIYRYSPEGDLLGSISTAAVPEFTPDRLVFNRLTGDLLVLGFGGIGVDAMVKFTAASGYGVWEAPVKMPVPGSGSVSLDAENGVIYGPQAAVTETGDTVETYAIGGKSWSSPRPQGNFGNVTGAAFDETAGALYLIDISGVGPFASAGPGGETFGSNVAVWPGTPAAHVNTGPASSVGHTDATLTGHVEPTGGPVDDCQFEYATTTSVSNVRAVELSGVGSGSFRLGFWGGRSGWIPYDATASQVKEALVEPLPGIFTPIIGVTGPAGGPWRVEFSGFLAGSASTLQVIGNELEPSSATAFTDWDATKAPCVPAASPGSPLTTETDVTAHISGLTTGTVYRYRLAARGPAGRSVGANETVTPTPSPISTGAATAVQPTSVTLNGTVDPEGLETTYYFEYGPNRTYGNTSTAPPGNSVGTTEAGAKPVSDSISGLTPGFTYHYRVVAVNSKGTSYGGDRTFTSSPAVKHIETEAASAIHRTDATLNGVFDPNGAETHYYFQWGRTRRYGQVSASPPGTNLADTSAGDKQLSTVAEGLKPETTYHFRIVATNSLGTTFGADRTFTTEKAVKGVVTDPATEIETTAATLNGQLDPDGIAGTTYYFQWGKTTAYGRTSVDPPGEDVGTAEPGSTPLSARLEGLEPGVTYHYRLVATNSFGTTIGADQSFATPQGPSIEGASSDHVTASGADLHARINPHGFETSYRFEYGLTTNYGSVSPQGTLGALTSGQPVTVSLEGLQGLTYHFRVIAESKWGTTTTEDQTFEFNPPSCPNATVRQQTGSAYLPDCRAYELVSPARAGGATLTTEGPTSPLAGDRLAFTGYFNIIPGSGNPPNGGSPFPTGDLYVASRTASGWATHYVGLSGDQTLNQHGTPSGSPEPTGTDDIPTNQGMNRFLTWDYQAFNPRSYAPYMWDNEGNPLGRLPSNLGEVPGATITPQAGGFVGDAHPSPDFSHYAFSSIKTAFAPGGLTEAPGSAYDNDLSTGTVQVISKTAGGADIPQDGLGGTSSEYIRIPAVSTNGSHILMSTAGPNEATHLYLRVNDAITYEPSLGQDAINHAVSLAGMSADGTEVFFTSAVQMTADDHDTSVDLYRWAEDGGSPTLTRLSTGVEGTGDTDKCNPAWTSQCGVEVVHTGGRGDTSLASKTGAIYFYSPEQLDIGARGTFGQRNLYVYREGAPRYVTTLESTRPAERMDVSSDGSHMAFLTKSRVSSYDNAAHVEMYMFTAASRKLICVSCRPDGQPPTSDIEASQNGLFMSDDGRTFFTTPEALVARDSDGIPDVYEYVAGRPQLISSGTGDNAGTGFQPIGLVGVSADGVNAFISTYDTLVAQDENGPFYKFYDARVNGGIPFQSAAAPCAAADECHGEGSQPPPSAPIGSGAALGGSGNASEAPKPRHRKAHHHRKHRRHRHARHGRGR